LPSIYARLKLRKPNLIATVFRGSKTKSSIFFALFAGILTLSVSPTSYADLSAKVELSSAHSFRGIQQTDNNIAPSINAKYDHDNGFYLGTLISRNDFRSPSAHRKEHAYFLGYSLEASRNLDLDISFINYEYSETATGMDRDWREIHARFNFNGRSALILGVADNWLRRGKKTGQIEFSHLYPLIPNISLQATTGIILASNARGENYLYGELGLIYGISPNVYIRADLSTTDSRAKRLFANRASTDARLSIGYIF